MMKKLLVFLAAVLPVQSFASINNLKWQYRSDSNTQAYYATGLRDMSQILSNVGINLTNGPAGTFGGKFLDMTNATAANNLFVWPGQDNCPLSTNGWTVHLRLIPVNTGNPTAATGLFSFGSVRDWAISGHGGASMRIDTTSHFCPTAGKAAGTGSEYFSGGCFATALSFTANQPTDIWWVWDGTATAAHSTLWQAQNGATPTQVGAGITAGAVQVTPSRAACAGMITMDLGQNLTNNNNFNINEIEIWDDAETPSSYGTLAAFITPPSTGGVAYEGYNFTSLAASSVLSGTAYGPGPGSLTGSYVGAATTDVRFGTIYGGGTGSLHVPTASQVLNGVQVDATTGNVMQASTADVRLGTTYGPSSSLTGLVNIPSVVNVISGIPVDQTVGTWVSAPINKVESGYSYGASGTSLTGTDLSTDPGQNNVTNLTSYFINSVPKIGTFTPNCSSIPPVPGDVRQGIIYAVDAVGYIGTLNLPAASVVQSGISFDNSTKIGTLYSTDPGAINVANGVQYVINNASFTGVLNAITNYFKEVILRTDYGGAAPFQLTTTQGDTPLFAFQAQNGSGQPVNLTSASFQTQIKGVLGNVVTIPNSAHTLNVNQSGIGRGKFTVSLSSGDTQALEAGPYKEIVTRAIQGSSITYMHGQGILTVLPAEPVQ